MDTPFSTKEEPHHEIDLNCLSTAELIELLTENRKILLAEKQRATVYQIEIADLEMKLQEEQWFSAQQSQEITKLNSRISELQTPNPSQDCSSFAPEATLHRSVEENTAHSEEDFSQTENVFTFESCASEPSQICEGYEMEKDVQTSAELEQRENARKLQYLYDEQILRVFQLETENQLLREKIASLSETIETINTKVGELRKSNEVVCENFEKERSEYKSESGKLRALLVVSEKTRHDEHLEYQKSIKREIEDYQHRLRGIQESKDFLGTELVEAEAEISRLRKQLQESSIVQQELCLQLQSVQLKFADHLESVYQRKIWKSDCEVKSCYRCGERFTLLQRRHH
eukprot:Sdes_comp10362_c0_seq1m2013